MIKLNTSNLREAEYERRIYAVTPEHGTTIEQMLDPAYWANVGYKFKPGDRIEVISEDSTWFAELLVIASARLWAKVSTLRFVELAETVADGAGISMSVASAPAFDDYVIKWGTGSTKFRVIRKQDKEVIREGFATKRDAEAWLLDHLDQTMRA